MYIIYTVYVFIYIDIINDLINYNIWHLVIIIYIYCIFEILLLSKKIVLIYYHELDIFINLISGLTIK